MNILFTPYKKFHLLRSELHSILTPVEWTFTTQRVESRPVHSIFTPKEVLSEWLQWQLEWNSLYLFFTEY